MKLPNLLPTPWRLRLLGVYAVTLLAVIAVVVFSVRPVVSEQPRADAGVETPRFVSSGQVLADQAVAAFAGSAAGTDAALTPAQRRSGLPTEPVAGLTSQTPAGPVQMVLPSGLCAAEHTAGGQVVYPDNGAGFDFLAENTSTGTRTVARISNPSGVRMVTTFVRTPAGTVMLAHTNGHLTINRATPAAETVGMFSPAETRDAAGNLVPSSYIVRQVAPQLYQLSEVIDPGPTTEWPVFVDPLLHLAGTGGTPLPQFDVSFSGITDAVGSGLETLGNAASTVAEATVSAATSVGTFVKENPLESAMLVGGVALALTGVGGPASAAMITAASVNIASAGVDIAAAAMPDNEALGIASTTLGIASAFTPQGAAKQVVEEGIEQLVKHTDDIIDVTKAAPTPPAQLSQQVSGTAGPTPPTSPLADTPKAPNAPPNTSSTVPGGENGWALPPGPGDQRLSTDITARVTPRQTTVTEIRQNAEYNPDTHLPIDPNTRDVITGRPDIGHKPGYEFRTTQEMANKYGLSRREVVEWENDPKHLQLEAASSNRGHRFEQPRSADAMYGEYESWLKHQVGTGNTRLASDPTAQRRLGVDQPVQRPSSPTEQRINQQAQAQATANQQRTTAQDTARRNTQSSTQRSGDSGSSRSDGSSSQRKSEKKKKKESSTQKKRKRDRRSN